MDQFSHIIAKNKRAQPYALCVVVDTKGSVPAGVGSKLLVYADGSTIGTIGGGRLEKATIADALKVLESRNAEMFRHDLLHQHAMCCGGSVSVYIEPQLSRPRLYIFGAGHIGHALSGMCPDLGFDTFVIDERKSFIDSVSSPEVNKMNLDHTSALQAIPFDNDSFFCIMTHDHSIDREILRHCITRPHAYLGMIGSRRKVEVTRKIFRESGFATDEQIDAVNMPMGVDIHAHSPTEIAVSIAARLIQVKNTFNNG